MLAILALASAWGAGPVVENRFVQKEGRFEIAPMGGFAPNDPVVKGRVGSMAIAWHAGEELAVEGSVSYSPLRGPADLKGIPLTVLGVSPEGTPLGFEKVELASSLGLRWAPLYGKVALAGEKVASFDVCGFGGAGLVAKSRYAARREGDEVVLDAALGTESRPAAVLGAGADVFLGRSVALKLDARAALHVDGGLDDHLTVSAGLGFFLPGEEPRIQAF